MASTQAAHPASAGGRAPNSAAAPPVGPYVSDSFVWDDSYWTHIAYIAREDPNSEYYTPTRGRAIAPDLSDDLTQGCGIPWPELKAALKFQLHAILFDLPACPLRGRAFPPPGIMAQLQGAADQSRALYPPNTVVAPSAASALIKRTSEAQSTDDSDSNSGLSVARGTLARGRGFPSKPIPTLHNALAIQDAYRRFFPPYPVTPDSRETSPGAVSPSPVPEESTTPRSGNSYKNPASEAAAAAAAKAAATVALQNRFTVSLPRGGTKSEDHSPEQDDETKPDPSPETQLVRDGSGEPAGNTSPFMPHSDPEGGEDVEDDPGTPGIEPPTGLGEVPKTLDPQQIMKGDEKPSTATLLEEAKADGLDVRPGDLDRFYEAPALPPPGAFGSWGRRSASTQEVVDEYGLLCSMLDEFDAPAASVPSGTGASTSTSRPSLPPPTRNGEPDESDSEPVTREAAASNAKAKSKDVEVKLEEGSLQTNGTSPENSQPHSSSPPPPSSSPPNSAMGSSFPSVEKSSHTEEPIVQHDFKTDASPLPPFTIQRICELILEPHRWYTSLPKFVYALKRTLAVSTRRDAFPTIPQESAASDPIEVGEQDELSDTYQDEPLDQHDGTLAPEELTDPLAVSAHPTLASLEPKETNRANQRNPLGRAISLPAENTLMDTTRQPIASPVARRPRTGSNASLLPWNSTSRTEASRPREDPLWGPIPFLVRREREAQAATLLPSDASSRDQVGPPPNFQAERSTQQKENPLPSDSDATGPAMVQFATENVLSDHKEEPQISHSNSTGSKRSPPDARSEDQASGKRARRDPTSPSRSPGHISDASLSPSIYSPIRSVSPPAVLARLTPVSGPLGVPPGQVDEVDDPNTHMRAQAVGLQTTSPPGPVAALSPDLDHNTGSPSATKSTSLKPLSTADDNKLDLSAPKHLEHEDK